MIVLKNGTWIDWNDLSFRDTDVYIADSGYDRISLTEPPPAGLLRAKYIDCQGKLITRAFACGHHHVYSALARGMPAPAKTPSSFHEKLKYVWWTLDQCLDRDMIYASALATAMDCLKTGCTFVIDHHASPSAIPGSMNLIKKAFEEVGVGHLLCYEITDRYGEEKACEALDETENYLKENKGLVGLHAGFTVGQQTLTKAVELASKYDTGIHVHVAEDPVDQYFSIKHHGKRVVQRYRDAGLFELKKNILVHCLHLDAAEREVLAETGTWVTVNADSNLNNRVGIFNGKDLGENIMLGTDGMHSNMIKSAQTAYFSSQHTEKPSPSTIYKRLRNVHRYLDTCGFQESPDESLLVIDYDSPTPVTKENFTGHFLYGLSSRHIQHVISHGMHVLDDHRLTRVDEAEIRKEIRLQAERLWEKFRSFRML